MRLAQTAFSLLLMLLPAAAGAVDLELSGEAVAGYDDNIYRTSGNETGDALFRFTPVIGFSSQESKLGWRLRYRPTYEIFPQHTDADNLTHRLWGTIDYALDDKTAISLSETYRRLEVLNYPYDDGVDDESNVVPDQDISREKIDINDGSFRLSHAFSSKWTGYTGASYRLFYTTRKNSGNSKSFSGSQSFQYALDAANDVGLGGSVTVQMYDGFEYQPANNSFFYSLFGSWERRFGEGTTLNIQVGPALVHTDQDDLQVDVTGEVPTYPHVYVPDQIYSDDLMDVYPSFDPDGNPNPWLEGGVFGPLPLTIPEGSVLVPSVASCGSFNYVAGSDRCAVRIVIPASDPLAQVIHPLAPNPPATVPLNLVGSDKGASGYKFTIFAEAKLTQRWTPTLRSSLEYSRRDSTASAQGSGTVQDLVSFVTVWQPTERWDLSLRGTWLKRNSPTGVSQQVLGVDPSNPYPFPMLNGDLSYVEAKEAIDTERWSVFGRIARRMTRRTTMTLRLSYADQHTRRSDRNPNSFHNFMALVGVRYDFDPIRF